MEQRRGSNGLTSTRGACILVPRCGHDFNLNSVVPLILTAAATAASAAAAEAAAAATDAAVSAAGNDIAAATATAVAADMPRSKLSDCTSIKISLLSDNIL